MLLAGWLWWKQSDPETTERGTQDPTEDATEQTNSPPAPLLLEQPSKAAEQAPSPSPAIRKPPAAAPAPIPANVARAPLRPGDLSDDAIAAFSPETIEMLNKHKYWSAQKGALLVGLYDTWVDRKEQGVDAEDVRQQIAWALQGVFMEDY
ncbi:MAG: hypothetical protein ACJ8F1_04375 [Polyangia bacterium]